MEIRCKVCSHTGEAAEVKPVDGGVGLVCESCGHVNIASTSASSSDGEGDATSEQGYESTKTFSRSLESLIPEPGPGDRCRKCAYLLPEEDNCPRCGLSQSAVEDYEPGQAPWERAPEGLESAQLEADALWNAWRDGQEELDAFLEAVIEAGLLDFGLRKLQFYLVDYPDDDEALEGLQRLADRLDTTIQVAHTQAEVASEEFNDDIKQFRTTLMLGALIFWTLIFLLFSWLFLDVF